MYPRTSLPRSDSDKRYNNYDYILPFCTSSRSLVRSCDPVIVMVDMLARLSRDGST